MAETDKGKTVEIRGIGFVGSHTDAYEEMSSFAQDVLGLQPITVDGISATLFAATHFRAPDGKLYELVEERSR